MNRRVAAQFLGLAVIWGLSFLFIKIGLEGLSPGQVVLGRLGSGAVALVLVCLLTRQRLPRDRTLWGQLFVVSLLLCVFPFLLFAWAEQHVSSGVASILNATTPLMTMAVTLLALPEERPTRVRVLGLLTGFAGVVLVLGPWRQGLDGSLAGELACLGATFCYGLAFVVLRRYVAPRRLPAVPVATAQVGLGAVVMLLLAPVLATGPVDLSWRVVGAVGALGVLGTGLAYVWNTNVVAGWGATNASTVTYLTPLVGVVAGALVLHERVSWNQPVGAAVVVFGIAVSQGRFQRAVPTAGLEPARGAS